MTVFAAPLIVEGYSIAPISVLGWNEASPLDRILVFPFDCRISVGQTERGCRHGDWKIEDGICSSTSTRSGTGWVTFLLPGEVVQSIATPSGVFGLGGIGGLVLNIVSVSGSVWLPSDVSDPILVNVRPLCRQPSFPDLPATAYQGKNALIEIPHVEGWAGVDVDGVDTYLTSRGAYLGGCTTSGETVVRPVWVLPWTDAEDPSEIVVRVQTSSGIRQDFYRMTGSADGRFSVCRDDPTVIGGVVRLWGREFPTASHIPWPPTPSPLTCGQVAAYRRDGECIQHGLQFVVTLPESLTSVTSVQIVVSGFTSPEYTVAYQTRYPWTQAQTTAPAGVTGYWSDELIPAGSSWAVTGVKVFTPLYPEGYVLPAVGASCLGAVASPSGDWGPNTTGATRVLRLNSDGTVGNIPPFVLTMVRWKLCDGTFSYGMRQPQSSTATIGGQSTRQMNQGVSASLAESEGTACQQYVLSPATPSGRVSSHVVDIVGVTSKTPITFNGITYPDEDLIEVECRNYFASRRAAWHAANGVTQSCDPFVVNNSESPYDVGCFVFPNVCVSDSYVVGTPATKCSACVNPDFYIEHAPLLSGGRYGWYMDEFTTSSTTITVSGTHPSGVTASGTVTVYAVKECGREDVRIYMSDITRFASSYPTPDPTEGEVTVFSDYISLPSPWQDVKFRFSVLITPLNKRDNRMNFSLHV